MTESGTAAYRGRTGMPGLVAAAVAAATQAGFASSCRPEQGELLRVLAAGVGAGVIGETGTGCGVGLDPAGWLRPGGVVVMDDFTPMTGWPPKHLGRPDTARLYWLEHPRLRAAELRVAPTAATVVATFLG